MAEVLGVDQGTGAIFAAVIVVAGGYAGTMINQVRTGRRARREREDAERRMRQGQWPDTEGELDQLESLGRAGGLGGNSLWEQLIANQRTYTRRLEMMAQQTADCETRNEQLQRQVYSLEETVRGLSEQLHELQDLAHVRRREPETTDDPGHSE